MDENNSKIIMTKGDIYTHNFQIQFHPKKMCQR
jgi:hypothetical protein